LVREGGGGSRPAAGGKVFNACRMIEKEDKTETRRAKHHL